MISNNSDTSRMTLLGRLPLAILALLCMVMTHLTAMADVEFYYNVGYPMDDSYWPLDESLDYHGDPPLQSSNEMMGSLWEEMGFTSAKLPTYSLGEYRLTTCLAGGISVDYTAYIRSIGKIAEPVSGLAVEYKLDGNEKYVYVEDIALVMSSNEDFSGNKNEIKADINNDFLPRATAKFYISNPRPNMYYKIVFKLKKASSSNWFKVLLLKFALPESTEGMPIYHETTLPGNEGFRIDMEAYGNMQLHVMWGHYDSDENRIDYFYSTAQDANGYAAQSNEPDIIQTLSRSWKSNVSSPYSYTFKPDEGETYIFRAKSVSADDPNHQSNEIVKKISHDGIVTGIESVAADADTREELWFNMQGVRVASPRSPGVYIHVRDGKARKIVL